MSGIKSYPQTNWSLSTYAFAIISCNYKEMKLTMKDHICLNHFSFHTYTNTESITFTCNIHHRYVLFIDMMENLLKSGLNNYTKVNLWKSGVQVLNITSISLVTNFININPIYIYIYVCLSMYMSTIHPHIEYWCHN